MHRLQFGERARRRARRQARRRRIALAFTLASLLLALFGVTVPNLPLQALQSLLSRPRPVRAAPVETSDSTAASVAFSRGVFEARPVPARPNPQPAPVREPAAETDEQTYSGSVTEIIYTAADEFGIDGGYLLSVAECESSLNPGAVSPAGYHGLFQFDEQTWAAYGYGSIYDPVAQARTAAELLAAGEASRWPSCA